MTRRGSLPSPLNGEGMLSVVDTSKDYFPTLQAVTTAKGGHFFTAIAASDSSFVSGHSLVAWSSAAVLAGEYTRPGSRSASTRLRVRCL